MVVISSNSDKRFSTRPIKRDICNCFVTFVADANDGINGGVVYPKECRCAFVDWLWPACYLRAHPMGSGVWGIDISFILQAKVEEWVWTKSSPGGWRYVAKVPWMAMILNFEKKLRKLKKLISNIMICKSHEAGMPKFGYTVDQALHLVWVQSRLQ